MKKIGQIASFLTRYISILILICSAVAFWKPESISWATGTLPYF